MRSLLAVALLGIGVFTVFAAPVPKDKKKTVEDRILGTWKLAKTDAGVVASYTFTITFKKGGEMAFTRTYSGDDIPPSTSPGKFKTTEPDEKYKFGSIDWTVKEGNRERGEVSKILELTDDVLEFEDPDGRKEKFERVKEK